MSWPSKTHQPTGQVEPKRSVCQKEPKGVGQQKNQGLVATSQHVPKGLVRH